jgi:hypothetical protein
MMAMLVISATACLDLSPSVVAQSEAGVEGSGTSQACMACFLAPSGSGGGCADEWVACHADAICGTGLDCSIRDDCYSQSDDLLPVCTLNCANKAGFMSQDDLTTKLALAWYHCAIDKCHKKCQGDLEGGAPVVDAGGDVGGGDAPPDAPGGDGGGACLNAADEAATMSASFANAPRDCGIMCFTSADPNCARDCMQKTGLSRDCAVCWGDTVNCGAKNCLAQCLDPTNPECRPCSAKFCDPAFHACSGT